MITMNVCDACPEIAKAETTTVSAMTSSCAPSSRHSRLARTVASDQLVPHPANGLDVFRPDGMIVELLPKLADVHVDRPVHHHGFVERVDVGQQLIAGEDAAGKFHQRLQQLVFDGSETDFPSVQ